MSKIFDPDVEDMFFSESRLDKTTFLNKIHTGFSCVDVAETHVSRHDTEDPPSRLYWVLGNMAARLDSGSQDLVRMHGLYAIHDHKGNLISIWNRSPTLKEVCALTEAWHSVAEYEHVILVYPPDDDPYTWDVSALEKSL